MEKLFSAIFDAWCWCRVVVGLTLLGVGLGAGAYYLIGGLAGIGVGAILTVLGLYFGVRLAGHARRRGQLVEFAHGLPPSDGRASETDDERNPSK